MIADFAPVLEKQVEEMPSLNQSYVCAQVMKQLLQYEDIQPLPELTLDIDKGATPDISIFPRANVQPNFLKMFSNFSNCPSWRLKLFLPVKAYKRC